MWEILSQIIQAAIPALINAGSHALFSPEQQGPEPQSFGQEQQTPPASLSPETQPISGAVGAGSTARPSMSFQGGFTGGAPTPSSQGLSPLSQGFQGLSAATNPMKRRMNTYGV